MSTVYSTYAGFVGMGDGKTARLDIGDAHDLADAVVQAHPELFTARKAGAEDEAPAVVQPIEPTAPEPEPTGVVAEPEPTVEPAAPAEPPAKPTETLTQAGSPRRRTRKAAK